MTGCPITAIKNMFGFNLNFITGKPRTLPGDPDGMADLLLLLNSAAQIGTGLGDTLYAANTTIGNKGILVRPGEDGTNVEDAISTEVHGGMRQLVGKLGSCLDKSRLPAEFVTLDKQLKIQRRIYSQQCADMKNWHTAYQLENGLQKVEYKGLSEFETLVIKDLGGKEIPAEIGSFQQLQKSNMITTNILTEQTALFAQQEEVPLKGMDTTIANSEVGYNARLAEWLYHAEIAAQAMVDTTKIPSVLSRHLISTLNTSDDITQNFFTSARQNDYLDAPPFTVVFQNSLERMQQRVSLCGSFGDLQRAGRDGKPRHIDQIVEGLHLDHKKTYDAARLRAEAGDESAPDTGGRTRAHCPFHKGLQ